MIRIQINRRVVETAEGSTVAAAMLAAGEMTFRRSVTGEPRAALCGMGICFECRVTIDGIGQVRSCQQIVRDGMVIET